MNEGNRRSLLLTAAALAIVPIFVCMGGGLWTRSLSMDNRFYFYISERAASGVPPHVSAPDVKTQLSTLVDGASIAAGRLAGIDDVHAGRMGILAILIAGIWGVGLSVFALGATPAAATLGAMSVLSFSGMSGHVAVGFNPKILLFTLLAWGPWLVARGRFFAAGACASAAMCCWQPAAIACVATALAALTTARPWNALFRCIAGGVAVFLLYEAYFAWHGVLAAQLFQSFGLPQGSVHDSVDWVRGAEFVLFGSWQGTDRFAAPGTCFVLLVAGSIATLVGLRLPAAGRSAAPAAAVVLVAVAGTAMSVFTAYEHQAEPDRFLLCAYFAIAAGVVMDRVLHLVFNRVNAVAELRLQGALAAVLFVYSLRGITHAQEHPDDLEMQRNAGRVIAMIAETHGSVWSYNCVHLLAFAHLTNHHPLAFFWDDLRRYVDEETFSPVAHGRLPDVIVACRRVPGAKELLKDYREIRAPGLAAEKARVYVRDKAALSSFDGAPTVSLLD